MTKIADLAIEALRHFNVELGPGLTAEQIGTIEATYDFRFNPDHAALLSQASPAGWLDWFGDPGFVRRSLDWPVEGTIFDVEENGFWLTEWGPRPAITAAAVDLARNHLAAVPRLIPIVGHRYQAAAPAPAEARFSPSIKLTSSTTVPISRPSAAMTATAINAWSIPTHSESSSGLTWPRAFAPSTHPTERHKQVRIRVSRPQDPRLVAKAEMSLVSRRGAERVVDDFPAILRRSSSIVEVVPLGVFDPSSECVEVLVQHRIGPRCIRR